MLLVAERAGIKEVILPKATGRDLQDIPEDIRNEPTFVWRPLRRSLKEAPGIELRRTVVLRAGSSIIPVQNV
jgi:ATP-dependent Lon protease